MHTYSAALVLLSVLFIQGCEWEIENYQNSWEHQAHSLQRQLDMNVPLTRSTFLGTHNSYNSSSYTTPQSYFDPNQTHSIFNQLQMDIRALELDVHSFNAYNMQTKSFYKDLLLCHGTDGHIGCSPFDRSFKLGLQEIADWISQPQNAQEVLLVYIEDHIEATDYDVAVQMIEDTIGPYIYKPQNPGCTYLASTTTKAEVLATSKNIILISDGCNNESFNLLVHGGFEGGPGGYPTAGVEDLSPAPSCLSGKYNQQEVKELFVRIQEDRTFLSNLVGVAGPKVTPEVVNTMLDCEINLIGMDKLRPFDGRLTAAIWSWEPEHPAASPTAQCAYHNSNDKFESHDCSKILPFACRDDETGDWYITAQEGTWQQGFDACASGGMKFTVPFNAYDNNRLGYWKKELNIPQAWIGYGKNELGNWQAH